MIQFLVAIPLLVIITPLAVLKVKETFKAPKTYLYTYANGKLKQDKEW